MIRGICLLTCIPVRIIPDHKSEIVNQLLWCDLFYILQEENNWFLIKSIFDEYEGWIPANQATIMNKNEFDNLLNSKSSITASLIGYVNNIDNKTIIPVPAGSNLYNINDKSFTILNNSYTYEGFLISDNENNNPVKNARLFLDTPYMWGGRTAMGIDCSGFTQIAFKMAGITIKRDAKDQAQQGEKIDFIEEAVAGDLLFFGDDKSKITHVGILVDNGIIIHAHGRVRLDKVDHNGIYNSDKKEYTHTLRLVKRIL